VVDGSYDDVNRLCSELTYERPWAFVNVNMRAYYAEGSKTIALETAEQLGWRAPDRVVAPIASGSLYTKILQGFEQGRAAGLIEPGPGAPAEPVRRRGVAEIVGEERHHRVEDLAAERCRRRMVEVDGHSRDCTPGCWWPQRHGLRRTRPEAILPS
jgi:threonine synthase